MQGPAVQVRMRRRFPARQHVAGKSINVPMIICASHINRLAYAWDLHPSTARPRRRRPAVGSSPTKTDGSPRRCSERSKMRSARTSKCCRGCASSSTPRPLSHRNGNKKKYGRVSRNTVFERGGVRVVAVCVAGAETDHGSMHWLLAFLAPLQLRAQRWLSARDRLPVILVESSHNGHGHSGGH